MTRFYPDEYLKQVMPGGVVKNGLLYDNLSIKQRYMKALYKAAGREGKALKETVQNTIAYYAKREEGIGDQALLSQRIENFLVWHKVQEEKEAHKGQWYRWLASDAQNPDPEHQLHYGEIRRVGDGEMPGERYGCRCGIEWLDEKEMTASEKQEAVRIDFTKDNILPRLNSEELEVLGEKDKPILFKQRTLNRNANERHKDILKSEYADLLGQALYNPIMKPIKDPVRKNYWHFIGQVGEHKSVVLLDVEIKKTHFEIVHLIKMKERGVNKLLRKIKRLT